MGGGGGGGVLHCMVSPSKNCSVAPLVTKLNYHFWHDRKTIKRDSNSNTLTLKYWQAIKKPGGV